MDTDYDKFIKALRSALNNLYAPDQLRRNPLTELLGISSRIDAPAALQKALIDAIEQLKPASGDPGSQKAWQAHDLLYFRYVRGYSREEVAGKLGISDRQLSREQRAAIDALALTLWQTGAWGSNAAPGLSPAPAGGSARASPGGAHPGEEEGADDADGEDADEVAGAAWIEDLPVDTPSAWSTTFRSVLELLHPLMEQHGVHLRYEQDADFPDLFVPPNTLRQSLLIILGWLIPMARNREVTLSPRIADRHLVVTAAMAMDAHRAGGASTPIAVPPEVKVLRQLLERVGGWYRLTAGADRLEVTFSVPALAQVPVLVIDDNADTIRLFRRYLQETRYSVVSALHPADIERQIARHQPRIIILDVMMPEVDGWELLVRLRQHTDTHAAAILICSILPLENLALLLGANGFLQKPVLPQELLSRLDEQLAQLADEF